MFTRTAITMSLASIALVAINVHSPVSAAEPADPIITETPGLPGADSYTFTVPTLEDALADYLAGLGPEEDDFGGPAEVTVLPDDVLAAITDPTLDVPGLGVLPPLTIDADEPPVDELACGEPGAICDEPDEGAELPLDPTDVCGDEGTACDFDTSGDGSGAVTDEHPWDVPLGDDEEAPFDDDGWVEPDHDEASYGAATSGSEASAPATEGVTTTTTTTEGATIDDSTEAAIPEASGTVSDVALALTAPAATGTDKGIDPAMAAVAGLLTVMLVAAIGYGAYRMGRNGA